MNIKIVICFILICYLPAASADTLDSVMVAKSSGFIKEGESLFYQNYIIKAKVLDETSASIAVYKNQIFIEKHTFHIFENKKIDNIWITLLGIKEDYSWISINKLENIKIWRPYAKKQLKWGDLYTVDDYKIDVDSFGTDSVNLKISNASLSEIYSFYNNSVKNYEDLRIVVRNINRTGSIELEIFTRTAPRVKADIFTEKDEYFPDETINVVINITGDDFLNVVSVNLKSDNDVEIQPHLISVTNVKEPESISSKITGLPPDSDLTITAIIETLDYYNIKHRIELSKVIHVTPVVSITKRVPEDTDEENVTVELIIHNSASIVEHVSVYDTIGQELNLEQLDWRISIEPGRSTILTYIVSPQKSGKYVLPPAIAKWKKSETYSKQVVMTIHRPDISITKTAIKNKGFISVELFFKNTGDRPAKVAIYDTVPDGYPVISGETTWSDILEAGESGSISYSLQGDIENLPPARAEYHDIYGVVRHAESNMIAPEKVYFNEKPSPEKEELPVKIAPYDMLKFMISSFVIIGGIISSVTMTAYLSIKLNEG